MANQGYELTFGYFQIDVSQHHEGVVLFQKRHAYIFYQHKTLSHIYTSQFSF